MLKELLKKYLVDDAKVTEFMQEMKANKVYLSNQENIDTRYAKLQNELTAKTQEHQQSLDLIEQLKATNQGNEMLQQKISEYEKTVNDLKATNLKQAKENALKIALLSNKAKAEDIDYLMFKLSKDEEAIKVDDKGEITNIKELLDGMKTNYPSHFETGAKKKVDVQKLPDDKGNGDRTVTKEQFDKMGYQAKNKLFQENKELFEELSKGE